MHRWKTLRRKRPKPSLPSLTNPSSVTETAPAGLHTTPQLDGRRRESAFPSGGAEGGVRPRLKGNKKSVTWVRKQRKETKDKRTDWLNQDKRERLKHKITRMGHRAECQGICTLLKWFMSQKKPDQGALISSTSQVQNRKCLQSWQGRVVGVAHDIRKSLPLPLDLRWRLLIKNLDSVCYLTRGFVSPRCSTVSQEGIIFGAEKSLKDKNVLKLNIFPINQLRTV